MDDLKITICPSCGGKNIKKVRKMVTGSRGGKHYSAPNIEFYECPDCGERVYDSVAMRRIEEHSTVPMRQRPARKIA
jgi:YgiT-type zinc finger domain-containing protein